MLNGLKNSIKWTQDPFYREPVIKTDPHLKSKREGFSAKYCSGILTVQGNSRMGEKQGEIFFKSLASSRCWPEFLGISHPLYPLRPLWISGEMCSRLVLHGFHSLPDKILQLGYNTLIVGGIDEEMERSSFYLQSQFQSFQYHLNDNGIRLVLNLSSVAGNKQSDLMDILPRDSVVLFCSEIKEECSEEGDDRLYLDKITDEIHYFEKRMKGCFSLLYYLPIFDNRNYGNFLHSLSLRVLPKTVLAFPAASEGLKAHPFWIELRQMQEPLGLQLLPIINYEPASGYSLCYDHFESCISFSHRHLPAGFAAYISDLGEEGSFLHGNLWVTGHLQWKCLSPDTWIDTWFRSFHPDTDYFEYKYALTKLRQLVCEMAELQNPGPGGIHPFEELRSHYESLRENLRVIEFKLSRIKKIMDPMTSSLKQVHEALILSAQAHSIHLSRL